MRLIKALKEMLNKQRISELNHSRICRYSTDIKTKMIGTECLGGKKKKKGG